MISNQTTLGSVNGAEVGCFVPSVRLAAPAERLDEPDEPGRRLELVLPLCGMFGLHLISKSLFDNLQGEMAQNQ